GTDRAAIEDILQPGSLLKVGAARVACGGAVNNTGMGFRALGLKVAFMALVGTDTLGQVVCSILARHGSSEGVRQTEKAATSYTIVVAPPGIDRMFIHHPGTNDLFSADDIDYDIVARSRLFHLGYPPVMRALYLDRGAELIKIFRRAKELGVTTSLDLAMADRNSEAGRLDWRAVFAELLPYVDCILPSVEESFMFMFPEQYEALRESVRGELIEHIDTATLRALAREFLDMGCGLCMLKAGHQGLYLRTGPAERISSFGRACPGAPADWADKEFWCPAFMVESIVNTTGSGDVCIAGFLSGLLHGRTVRQCLKLGALSGCLALRSADVFSGLKSFAECEDILAKKSMGIRTLERELGPGWEWDSSDRIFHFEG
ncbi:MAG: carbohydrate kinase family protein, partial [Gemmatimonadota bacterium]|nr:carbohydrate kinase family protein [Gemmatimonadota bacterium]